MSRLLGASLLSIVLIAGCGSAVTSPSGSSTPGASASPTSSTPSTATRLAVAVPRTRTHAGSAGAADLAVARDHRLAERP